VELTRQKPCFVLNSKFFDFIIDNTSFH